MKTSNNISKEYFCSTLNNLKNAIQKQWEMSKNLSNVLGGDTSVHLELCCEFVDKEIELLTKEFNDKDGWIEWLFYECMIVDEVLNFNINNKKYKGTPENIYELCLNKKDDK